MNDLLELLMIFLCGGIDGGRRRRVGWGSIDFFKKKMTVPEPSAVASPAATITESLKYNMPAETTPPEFGHMLIDEAAETTDKAPKRKVVMIMSYRGTGYSGMQMYSHRFTE